MEISKDERNLGMLAHLLSLFTSFLGPLVIYLMKKDDSEFVSEQAKEALNFQISMTIYAIASSILMIVIIGIFTGIAVGFAYVIFPIIAAIKASNGENYKYPLTIRFLK